MGASAAEHDQDGPTFRRNCHLCNDDVESDVWYARTEGTSQGPTRVYACPQCYFDLGEEERDTYYRERV